MTMTDKLMEQLHQEIDDLAMNPTKHGIYDDEGLIEFCISYVLANLDDIAEAWKELEELCPDDGWTIERVKEELPDIKVITPLGKAVIGHVRGRRMQFAGVHTDDGFSCDAAWSTIVHCLNTDSALHM